MQPDLSKYEILGKIASGGMANVWLARLAGPSGFEKLVVLKTILPELANNAQFTEMFINEAKLAALLNHPNCVQIFDLGEEKGVQYIAMEYIEGFSLSRIRKRSTELPLAMPLSVFGRVVMDALSGLDYAHRLCDRAGKPLAIVHRDVSPDNILVTFSGQTKVVDFGIAKALSEPGVDSQAKTRPGTVKGKFAYMAPEYLLGKPIDGRADLFAMGVVMYQMLCGSRPFEGSTEALVIRSILDQEPASLTERNPSVPASLAEVVKRALEKDPAKRFENGRTMRAAIETALTRVADPDGVAAFLDQLWPPQSAERHALLQLASGQQTPVSSPILEKVTSQRSEIPVVRTDPSRATSVSATRSRLGLGLGIGVGIAAAVGITVAALNWPRAPTEVQAQTPVMVPQPQPPPPVPEPAPTPPMAVAPDPKPAAPPEKPSAKLNPSPTPGPKAVGQTGKVEIVSSLPVEVMWKGRKLGRAPGVFSIAAGSQVLRIINRDLGIERELPVSVSANETTRAEVRFAKAFVELRVSPWANVKIDGRPVGSTPLPIQELLEGHHVIELENPDLGASKRIVVDLKPGERKVIRETLG